MISLNGSYPNSFITFPFCVIILRGGDVLMNIEQIAHDLAIAKLTGSDLSPEEMLKKYHEYYETFLNLMRGEPEVATICSPQI